MKISQRFYIYIFELFFAEFQRGLNPWRRFKGFCGGSRFLNWVLEFGAKLFRVLWVFFFFFFGLRKGIRDGKRR